MDRLFLFWDYSYRGALSFQVSNRLTVLYLVLSSK